MRNLLAANDDAWFTAAGLALRYGVRAETIVTWSARGILPPAVDGRWHKREIFKLETGWATRAAATAHVRRADYIRPPRNKKGSGAMR